MAVTDNHPIPLEEHTNDVEGIVKGVVSIASRIVLVCAEFGMGRTWLLSQVVLSAGRQNIPARYEDFAGMEFDEAIEVLKEVRRWCRRQESDSSETNSRAVIACDNVSVGDEADIDAFVRIVRGITSAGHSVILSGLPELELFAERIGDACCLWSCDLRTPRPEKKEEALLYDTYVQGIPLLARALEKCDAPSYGDLSSDPTFQLPYLSVVESCVYKRMMSEERQVRCAMLLLGLGDKKELEEVVGGMDDALWRSISRDSPLFGVNIARDTFCCVGAHSTTCLNVAYSVLREWVKPWPWLVERIVQALAARSEFARAAIVSALCTDAEMRCSTTLQWGTRMIDAGEIGVIEDALEEARAGDLTHVDGYWESHCTLAALLGSRDAIPRGIAEGVATLGAGGSHARLALWCRSLVDGTNAHAAPGSWDESDAIEASLTDHGRALGLLFGGYLRPAYKLLLKNASRLEDATISAGLVSMDYILCSLLLGIVPNKVDTEAFRSAMDLFEDLGLTTLHVLCECCLEAGSLLAGRLPHAESLELGLRRVEAAGNALLRGVLLLANAVSDMRVGALTRAHVRLGQAEGLLEAAASHSGAMLKVTKIIHYAVKAQLGERVIKADFKSCKGVSKLYDDVVDMLSMAVGREKPRRVKVAGGWSAAGRLREIHWIVNVLANDCGTVSKRFRRTIPLTWVNAQSRVAGDVDAFVGTFRTSRDDHALPMAREQGAQGDQGAVLGGTQQIAVRMLGGFEVFVEGVLVPGNRLEKRRAKSLLALLAALPGHSAKRYIIMETIWPTYDYESANKCVYSATSTLRTELGSLLDEQPDMPLVIANKAQGALSLNCALFATDVDVFEGKARQLLDLSSGGREAIDLCREIEEVYTGDLFVPSTDGMGIMSTRSRELRSLFADAMIAGARAAMGLDMKTLACRFAHRAFEADDLREEGVRLLVNALCAAGRRVEAQRSYERFVGRVVDVTQRPPSHNLIREVEALLREPAEGERHTAHKELRQLALPLGIDGSLA